MLRTAVAILGLVSALAVPRVVSAQAPEKVPARKPGDGKLKPLCDAPGDYVRVRA